MVGLAVVVLLGAAWILVGKVLPKSHDVSRATPSPASASVELSAQPTRTPWPTPTPRPLGEVILLPGTPPSPTPQPTSQFSGWIRAKEDLAIRIEPVLSIVGHGSLTAGTLAYAWSDPETDAAGGDLGWMQITDPQPGGWIATTPNGVSVVDRIGPPPVPTSGYVNTLVAGQGGFLALASPAGRSDQPSVTLPLVSSDGAVWRWGSSPSPGWSAAWGPAGWLTFSLDTNGDTPEAWIWRSSDGVSWESLGAWIDPRDPGSGASQLVGTPRGYLLTTQPQGRGGLFGGSARWYSSDGVTWDEMPDTGLGPGVWPQITGTALGFYTWDGRPAVERVKDEAVAAFSSDGMHWAPILAGPSGYQQQIGAIDGRLIAISVDPVSGSAEVWIGSVVRTGLEWRRDPGQDQVFAGAAVSAVASDGQRLAFFGWSLNAERPIAWIRDGDGWATSLLPASFGGIPRTAAIGPNGFVVVGYRTNLRGANPVFWHQSADGSWAPEADPAFKVAPDPSTADCGTVPRNALEFTLLDRATAPFCLGDSPMTLRLYSVSCDGCYSEPGGRRTPEWLTDAGSNQLQLSPIESSNGWGQAVLAPNLTFDPSWSNHWVEVTGHFDDPASASCKWVPAPDEQSWYSGHQEVVNGCRQTFVVTALRLVDGP